MDGAADDLIGRAVRILKPRVAARVLAEDPRLAPWIARIGPVRIPRNEDPPFAYLVRAICFQQLAGAAARTIHGRLVEALGGDVRPERVLETPEEALRAVGLSRPKLLAVRDLAVRTLEGEVPLDDLHRLDDEAVVERLTRVRGIGVWTAQMYLLFRLRRADVWPAGDLGVRAGYARIHDLDTLPTEREARTLADDWRPWRSAAAWYCYRALDIDTP